MQVRFGTDIDYIAKKYTRVSDPKDHVEKCKNIWSSIPKKEWMHRFIHTLDIIPKNRYLELEMHRETKNWDELTKRFKVKFTFEHKSPLVDVVLQDI